MAITRITKPHVFRSYLVYDMEWIPGKFDPAGHMDIRLVGVYDGNRYRAYTSVEAFLVHELTHKNRGRWFYAHAGGLADIQFVLEVILASRGFTVKASCSGSSLIIVHVSRGKHTWHFVDSYWLLQEKLSAIGKYVGIDKGMQMEPIQKERGWYATDSRGIPFSGPHETLDDAVKAQTEYLEEWYRSAPLGELRAYNEIDCVILYTAIRQFEDVLYELGGQLKMTQASCAMELFRRRYLERDIETHAWVNEKARQAYFASRVEVLAKECHDAWYYDVNSSFPYAMTFPVPGNMLGTHSRMPDHGIYLSKVTIAIPDCFLPPIPTRLGGRLFFPTGRWEGWLSNVDIELLLSEGGKILQHGESISFEQRLDCKDYAETLYRIRATSSGIMAFACKRLMNALYGKFAECEYKSSIEIDPPVPKGPDEGWRMLFPGAFLVERRVPIPHMHVPISTHITAIARRTLYRYMSYSPELHYCDTDGFSSSVELKSVEGKLGYLKLEKQIKHGRFVTQKTYDLETVDGKHITKAKGFRKMTHVDFNRMTSYLDSVADGSIEGMSFEERANLLESTEIEYTRMARTRELLRDGKSRPEERKLGKKLRVDTLSKRYFYPDGQSRPWTMEELREVIPA